MAHIDQIIQERKEALEKAREKGWDPYAPKYDKAQTVAEARESEGSSVRTAGKIISLRTHGNITFADLKDATGKIQLFFRKDDLDDEAYANLKLIGTGDIVGVEGQVMKTSAGELSIQPSSYKLLTKALLPVPDEWYGLKDIETRYRKRYLDIQINDNVRQIFETRSRIITLLREFLDDKGFLEVETPILQPIYGGASARPFTTHYHSLDEEFYLRISVELYLKRLIVAGYEKVYELGKNFRNEGFSRAHNPEFTMLEFYWAYADYNDLMTFTENMLSSIIQEIKGSLTVVFEDQEYDFTPPWPRITYRDLIREHLDFDINEINTEEKLRKLSKERSLLDKDEVGYAKMLDEIYKKHVRPGLKGPLFLTDHPVELIPLAKRVADDPTKAASFQLLANGVEFIKAYNELNDPQDQKERWLADMEVGKRGGEDFQIVDDDYIEALSYGMPPTAGWGMGIDRFTAFLTDQHTIKDVILFPTLRPDRSESAAPRHNKEHNDLSEPKENAEHAPIDDSLSLSREDALKILNEHLKNKNMIYHSLAVEAVMRSLADKLGGNADVWGMAGLLHDADWEETQSDPSQHTIKTAEWIRQTGEENKQLIEGILAHNFAHNGFREPASDMEWALYTCDELTGFIVAVALTRPDKKLASVETRSVLKKFPVSSFAKPVKRDQITMCKEKLGIPLDEFVTLSLHAMQEISDEIGL